jgi:dynein light chain roadblock-type
MAPPLLTLHNHSNSTLSFLNSGQLFNSSSSTLNPPSVYHISLPSEPTTTMESLDESLALLSRMSSKQGVQSTLVLTRDTGAIVRSQGILAPDRTTTPQEGEPDALSAPSDPAAAEGDAATRDAEEIARHVWKFVQASGALVQSMDAEDELRLLRIRTRRNELMIVPSRLSLQI